MISMDLLSLNIKEMICVDCDYQKTKEVLIELANRNTKTPILCRGEETTELFNIRESTIKIIVDQLKQDALALRNHTPVSELCKYCPSTRAIREKERILETTAQRIAWQLFDDSFATHMRWAAYSDADPFYKDCKYYLLTDTEMIAIDVYRSIAEKKYRYLLQNLRAEYRCQGFPILKLATPSSLNTNYIVTAKQMGVVSHSNQRQGEESKNSAHSECPPIHSPDFVAISVNPLTPPNSTTPTTPDYLVG